MEYFKKFMSIFKKSETPPVDPTSNIDRSYKERQDEKKAELDRIATGIATSSARMEATEKIKQEMKRLAEQEGIARNLQVEQVRIEITKLPDDTKSVLGDIKPTEANLWMLNNEIEAVERLLEKAPQDQNLSTKQAALRTQAEHMTKLLGSKDQPSK